METLVTALGPVVVAAFAVQQLLELADPIFFHEQVVKYKKLILGFVSLAVGLVLAFFFGLRVMAPFGVTTADWLDAIVTAVLLSAGTEGSNSGLFLMASLSSSTWTFSSTQWIDSSHCGDTRTLRPGNQSRVSTTI